MNGKQAEKIPLVDVLKKLGHEPCNIRKDGTDYWYYSPFHSETKASFHVRTTFNKFKDFGGEGLSGGVLDFLMAYKKTDLKGALSWLNDNYVNGQVFQDIVTTPTKAAEKKQIRLIKKTQLQHPALFQYLSERKISHHIALRYVTEVHYLNEKRNEERGHNQTYFALGFPNIQGGHELRNKFFKGQVGEKTISFVPGRRHDRAHIFEGWMDFLSMITKYEISHEVPKFDSIILNSTSFSEVAKSFIRTKDYQLLMTWFDNDPTGERFSVEYEDEFTTKRMNHLYAGFDDMNEWLKNS